jgi:hypothetical protein
MRDVLDTVTGGNVPKGAIGTAATASTHVTSDSSSRRTFVALRSYGHYSTPDSRDTAVGNGSNGHGDGCPASHNMASSVHHNCNAEALLSAAAAASNKQEGKAQDEDCGVAVLPAAAAANVGGQAAGDAQNLTGVHCAPVQP